MSMPHGRGATWRERLPTTAQGLPALPGEEEGISPCSSPIPQHWAHRLWPRAREQRSCLKGNLPLSSHLPSSRGAN